ncbi:MAG: NBR1-Ig-like domain-containing protein [Chloroflexota bacterium]
MKKRTMSKPILILAMILVVLACELPAIPGLAQPSPIPGIETVIAGTARAAQLQTLTALPPTATPTSTPLPTNTPPDTPTPTATVILFVFSSPTFTPTTPPPKSAGAGCELITQEPPNDTVLGPKINFETYWTVKNTGDESWLDTSADFRYQSGTDISKKDVIDLPNSVGVGSEVTLKVSMKTPEKPGAYTTNWALTSGRATLCTLSLRIIVQ